MSGLLEPKLVQAPEIEGRPLSGEVPGALRGRAALIDFWDYSCVNCIRTLPYLREWHRRYAAKGLVVLGIHAPEFRFAREAEAVSRAVREFGIEYGVLLDNDLQLWQRFANRCWPAKYLVDGEGYIRYRHYGEGRYRETEAAIQALLREIDPEVNLPPLLEPLRAVDDESVGRACPRPTGELYLGYACGRVGNPSGFREDSAEEYHFSDVPRQDWPELRGRWIARDEFCEAASKAGAEPSRLRVAYSGAEVNLVMDGRGLVELIDNGVPVDHQSRGRDVMETADGGTVAEVSGARMYSLIHRDRFLSRTLELTVRSPGLRLYAFTFGTCVPR